MITDGDTITHIDNELAMGVAQKGITHVFISLLQDGNSVGLITVYYTLSP